MLTDTLQKRRTITDSSTPPCAQYDNMGQTYNFSRILTEDATLNVTYVRVWLAPLGTATELWLIASLLMILQRVRAVL